jgi:hypothetical protein
MAKNRRILKSGKKAKKLLKQGRQVGKQLLPQLFNKGLDRAEFERIEAPKVDFENVNKYLQPSVDDAIGFRGDTTAKYDELLGLRRNELGGLNTAENQILKEGLFRDIDRQRAGAVRDVARTPGLGTGSTFAQKRALGRDYGDQAIGANRQLILDNVDVRNRALNQFEGTVANRTGAIGGANDRVSALRGLQATGQQATDQFNANNQLNTSQFNSTGQFTVDQFNAGQQSKELGAKVGAISAGTGLVNDERDAFSAKQQQEKLLKFLEERDARLAQQAKGLFG